MRTRDGVADSAVRTGRDVMYVECELHHAPFFIHDVHHFVCYLSSVRVDWCSDSRAVVGVACHAMHLWT